jgi:hypothetical protein
MSPSSPQLPVTWKFTLSAECQQDWGEVKVEVEVDGG